jgi:DNA polymerase (family 10)
VSTPADLAGTLRELADLFEIKGASAEVRLIRRAADAGALPDLKTADRFIASILKDFQSGESSRAVTRARAAVPALIRDLLDTAVVRTSEATQLVRQLGVATLADLGQALDDGRVARLGAGFADRLAAYADSAEPAAIPLGRALELADALKSDVDLASIVDGSPGTVALEPAGDVRRFDPVVSNIVLVARSDDPLAAVSLIAGSPAVSDALHRSSRRLIFNYRQAEIDVRVPAPDEYGSVLFAVTGSRAHQRAMRARRSRTSLCAREEQIYSEAGLPWIAPELREGAGEIEAALAGRLPNLVERRHIRGDLHLHSTYSDGRDSIEAMVEAATALHYEYVAVTDHSQTAGASRTLGLADVPRQRDEIARLRERYPSIAILHGVEVDILANGRLDFDDKILERFDIVLASLHDRAGHDAARLTKRCLGAILHPLVNVICHPENRVMGRREGYPLDFAAVYDAAAQTGTALEIDGAPGHLDLEGARARAAAAAGVVLTIDSDCHRAHALDRNMQLGVGIARRGWVEPGQVLNTRSLADVRAFVAAKRRRGGW